MQIINEQPHRLRMPRRCTVAIVASIVISSTVAAQTQLVRVDATSPPTVNHLYLFQNLNIAEPTFGFFTPAYTRTASQNVQGVTYACEEVYSYDSAYLTSYPNATGPEIPFPLMAPGGTVTSDTPNWDPTGPIPSGAPTMPLTGTISGTVPLGTYFLSIVWNGAEDGGVAAVHDGGGPTPCPPSGYPPTTGGAEETYVVSISYGDFLTTPNPTPPDLGPCDGSASTQGCAQTPEPINPATGNEALTEPDDYRSADDRLRLSRTYNSLGAVQGFVGVGWRESFTGRSLVPTNAVTTMPPNTVTVTFTDAQSACEQGWPQIAASYPNGASLTATWTGSQCVLSNGVALPVYSLQESQLTLMSVSVQRATGSTYPFECQSQSCTGNPGVAYSLSVVPGVGFSLTAEDGTVESYNSVGQLLSVVFLGGYTQTLNYNGSQLSRVTDTFGRTLSYQYGSNNLIQSVTTPDGIVQYGYDSGNHLTSVTFPDGAVRRYAYGNGQFPGALTAVIDENGAVFATIGYDSSGRANQSSLAGGAWASSIDYTNPQIPVVTDALGIERTYQYSTVNGRTKVQAIVGPPCSTCGISSSVAYDLAGYYQSMTDGNGNLTQFTHDDSSGLLLQRIDGWGSAVPRTTNITWNTQFRQPIEVSDGLQGVSTTYDSVGNVLKKTLIDETTQQTRTWTYSNYTPFGAPQTITGPSTEVSQVTTLTYYPIVAGDPRSGQLEQLTDPLGDETTFNSYGTSGQPLSITGPNGAVTTLTYDARDRLTSYQVADEVTAFSYYPTGLVKQLTMPDGATLTYSYDSAHRLIAIQDGAGNSIQYSLDAMGNHLSDAAYDSSGVLTSVINRVYNSLSELSELVGSAGTSAVTTSFGYDNSGNQTSVSAPLNRNASRAFDALNRVVQAIDPNQGIAQIGYNVDNRVTSVIDPLGLTRTYNVNGFGEVMRSVDPASGVTVNAYDSAGNIATSQDARGVNAVFFYDALNRPVAIVYGDQEIDYNYDEETNGIGRLTSASDSLHSLAWQYDPHGRVIRKSQTVGNVSSQVSYTYANGDLVGLTTPSGQNVGLSYANHRIASMSVNGTTLLTNVQYEAFGPVRGWSWGSGATEIRAYDADGNPRQFMGIEAASYSVDPAFRIVGIANASNASLSYGYGYDSLNRNTSAQTTAMSVAYTYDADGNRLSQVGGSGPAVGLSSFTYNSRGRMATATTSTGSFSAGYDALGQRIEKVAPTGATVFVYDESRHLIGEYDQNGNLVEETIWMGDIPVAALQSNGSGGVNIFYIHADHVNNPKAITRAADGAVVWRWDQDPFGTAAANQDPSGVGNFIYNLRSPGQYYDVESGLNYNYYRDYDPNVGRYVESDPIGLKGRSYSTYAYVLGNPVSLSDPTGLCPANNNNCEQAQSQKPPCGSVKSGQISVGGDADWFSHGKDWSAGPGVNSSGQVFWNGTEGTATKGYGGKLSAGLSFSFSFSTSVLPPGMNLNTGSGTFWELQGDFVLGGGLRVETSADGSSISVDLKPSAGFAAYLGTGTVTSNSIASQPVTCTP